jgi:tRNA-2-methylthio-N6-dimethylallyladenosine synthase
MNERDSDDVAYKLKNRGYEIVDNEDIADVVLLNTCSVREQAENKALGKTGHLIKRKKKNPNFIVGIMGCMAQNRGSEILDTLPDLDLIVGTQKFHHVPDYLDKISNGKVSPKPAFIDLDEENGSQDQIRNHSSGKIVKASAFVSIMQGCNMKCSFCIVPKTRGKERYRSIQSIIDETHELVEGGTKEVTLLGQIVNAYGRGSLPKVNNKTPFVQLLEKLNDIDGLERIRFTSPHPISFGDDLIDCYKYLPKLCEHAHLPMQSGSDKILKIMNRPYTRVRFLEIVNRLRSTHSAMRISTDVIVGFPGETEHDFELTKSTFKESDFEMAFIFKYSERSGTKAVNLSNVVPMEIKERRNQELLSMLRTQSKESNSKSLGGKFEILVEAKAKKGVNMLMGRTRCNRKVVFKGDIDEIGTLKHVIIKETSATTLAGESV